MFVYPDNSAKRNLRSYDFLVLVEQINNEVILTFSSLHNHCSLFLFSLKRFGESFKTLNETSPDVRDDFHTSLIYKVKTNVICNTIGIHGLTSLCE
jgi:hypothetical protein